MSSAPVLAPLDLSDLSKPALIVAADLAERSAAPLHLLNARAAIPAYTGAGDHDAGYHALVERVVDVALGPGACAALKPAIHIAYATDPARAALELAGRLGPSTVVLGTHGRTGFQRFVHGSVAEDVIRRTTTPVIAVPNRAERLMPGPKHPVVAATDLSDHSVHVLRAAQQQADLYGAPVVVVHVVPPTVGPFLTVEIPANVFDVPEHVRAAAERQLAEAGLSSAELVVQRGVPAETIDRIAEERGAGRIVLATHGRGGLAHALVGSVTESVLRSTLCSVLVVRSDG
jgi:nucleotide-binding universal stress UspA family protein